MGTVATSQGRTVGASVTRAANTNTYTAGTVVTDGTPSGYLTFAACGQGPNGSGIIQSALLTDNANVATKPDLELWLFNKPPSVIADNVAWTPSTADLAALVDVIKFSTTQFLVGNAGSGAAGNSVNTQQNLSIPFNANTSGNNNSLFGVLVIRNAYVPISGEVFTVTLKVLD